MKKDINDLVTVRNRVAVIVNIHDDLYEIEFYGADLELDGTYTYIFEEEDDDNFDLWIIIQAKRLSKL